MARLGNKEKKFRQKLVSALSNQGERAVCIDLCDDELGLAIEIKHGANRLGELWFTRLRSLLGNTFTLDVIHGNLFIAMAPIDRDWLVRKLNGFGNKPSKPRVSER